METTLETRAIAAGIIKDKLKVNMQGAIVACHRLRNKKRVLVKFQDMEDRDAVYQARFEQPQQDTNKVIIHENLTETRANMIKLLGQMREKNAITNYHTKNGAIYARNSRDKRYTLIEPWLSEDDIMRLVQRASNKGPIPSDGLMRSQTLDSIPQGRVASVAADLGEFVVPTRRQTRQQAGKN